MTRYRKLVAAAVGMVVTLLSPYGLDQSGVNTSALEAELVQGIMALITVYSVYQFPNSEG